MGLEGAGGREQYDLLNFFEELGQLQKRTKVMEVFLFLDLHTEQCTCSAYDLKYKKRGCVV